MYICTYYTQAVLNIRIIGINCCSPLQDITRTIFCTCADLSQNHLFLAYLLPVGIISRLQQPKRPSNKRDNCLLNLPLQGDVMTVVTIYTLKRFDQVYVEIRINSLQSLKLT